MKVDASWLYEARSREQPPAEFGRRAPISLLGGRIRADHSGTYISDGLINVAIPAALMAAVILQVMSYVSGHSHGYAAGVRDAWAQRDRPRGSTGR